MSTVSVDALSNPSSPFSIGLTFGGLSVGMTIVSQSCSYFRIGSQVFFKIDFTLSAKGSSTGSAVITGLPLAPAGGNTAVAFGYAANLASITGQLLANIGALGGTTFALSQMGAASVADLTHANFTNTSRLIMSGWFSV